MSFRSNLFSYTSRSSLSPFPVVGSLLNRSFLIYVNEMAGATDEKILLYADDTAILVSNIHVDVIELKLKTALETISDRLVDNKLSLHLGKTESILFVSKRKLSNCENFKVPCIGVNIEAKTSVRYLGASIDNCLSWAYTSYSGSRNSPRHTYSMVACVSILLSKTELQTEF